jgi:hypothetical protein
MFYINGLVDLARPFLFGMYGNYIVGVGEVY